MAKEKYINRIDRNGNIYYQVNIKRTINGQRKTFTKNFAVSDYGSEQACLRAATAERNRMLNDLDTNSYILSNSKTFADCYEESKELFPRRYATVKKNDVHFNHYLTPLHNLRIQKITAYDIMKCLNSMISVASDKTIGEVFTIVKTTFKTARIKRYITINVTEEVILPKSEYMVKARKKTTDFDTVKTLTDYMLRDTNKKTGELCFNHKMIAGGLLVTYYTGMRPAEAFALDKADVNMTARAIHISKELGSSYTEKNSVRKTKTERSNRYVPICDELYEILEGYMIDDGNPILFHKYHADHFKMSSIQSTITRMCKKLGIEFTAYQSRHTFATDLITNGADIRTTMELMGHEDASMTIEYARSDEKKKKEVIKNRKYS